MPFMSDSEGWEPPAELSAEVSQAVKHIGPMGILLAGVMGAGQISATIILGASAGYSGMWLILSVGWVAAAVMYAGGKVCAYKQESPVEIINRYTHPVFTYALFAAILYAWIFIIISTGNLLAEATTVLVPATEPYIEIVVAVLVIATIIVFRLGYDLIKVLLSAVVLLITVIFLYNAFIVSHDVPAMLGGIVPTDPGEVGGGAIAGIVGGSISAGPILYAYFANDNGWGKDDLRIMAWDQIIFYGIVFTLFSLGIYLSAAAVLFGEDVAGALDAAVSIEPAVGTFAATAFTVGLWAAVFTTLGVLGLMFGYFVADLINSFPYSDLSISLSLNDPYVKNFLSVGMLFGILGPYLVILPPLPLITYALGFLTLMAPVTIVIFTIPLVNPRDGREQLGPWYLVLGMLVALTITLYAAWSTNQTIFYLTLVGIALALAKTVYLETKGQPAGS